MRPTSLMLTIIILTMMTKRIAYFLQLLFLLPFLLISANIYAGNLTASVDKNQMGISDVLQLTISYDQKVDNNKLNYQSLEKDFNVLSVSPNSSSSFQIINGKTSQRHSIQWRITLKPKRIGTMTIPGMNINGDISQAINIKVTQQPSNTAPTIIDLKASIDNKDTYVNQQVIITFNFKYARGVQPKGFNFDVSGTKIAYSLLGQINANTVENGIPYSTAKVTFAFFPEKVGTYQIKPQLFAGVYQRRQVVAQSGAISIKVKAPHLEQYPTAHWFPARAVNLREEWASNLDDIRVGEPISRTIILEVDGQQSNKLPSFTFDNNDDLKYYTNQPEFDQKNEPTGFKSTRIESIAIIAQKEGELTLPAITLPWWDIDNSQWREITLPAKTINVKPARQTFEQIPNIQVFNENPIGIDQNVQDNTVPTLWFYSTIVLTVLCLILLFVLILLIRKNQPNNEEKNRSKQIAIESEKQRWRQLQIQINKQDNTALYNAILKWGKAYWGDAVRNTQDIINRCNNDIISDNLKTINKNLYRSSSDDWDNDINYTELLEALGEVRKANNKQKARNKSEIPALYP